MNTTDPRQISILDYTYELPEARIAQHPLAERDASKLLVYRGGEMQTRVFRELPDVLPAGGLLVFNTTRVVRARLQMQRESGAWVELFCTDAADLSVDFVRLLGASENVQVRCFVGNGKRWKAGETLKLQLPGNDNAVLFAERGEAEGDQWKIALRWTPPQLTFAEILDAAGHIPLPPYMKREEETDDAERYQTIYAQHNGSVAAPTAGLHFTPHVLDALRSNGTELGEVTLHVGAGTFKPVKADQMAGHDMHREQIIVTRTLVEQLCRCIGKKPVTVVGTTALRTVESLYWFGRQLVTEPGRYRDALFVSQWEPYTDGPEVPAAIALRAIYDWMVENNHAELQGYTQLLIAPGYKIRLADALITNFHQPQSTLLLLVAAFIGDDFRKVYEYALANDYRFLSYGDSSILFRGS
ncbi:MAG: S-adenosylmethionine:tRNA ribosyltransferase-isomerase [Bacteroidia bacterium]|jgi:S-adenosylmethionine:tRNA ribosyltransferase-isomerase|nr:S-adenosylmethionine:tRNA ribosyltransferase-isomerase [Bacteroidia bacterium]